MLSRDTLGSQIESFAKLFSLSLSTVYSVPKLHNGRMGSTHKLVRGLKSTAQVLHIFKQIIFIFEVSQNVVYFKISYKIYSFKYYNALVADNIICL
jgi:hypothetical protein